MRKEPTLTCTHDVHAWNVFKPSKMIIANNFLVNSGVRIKERSLSAGQQQAIETFPVIVLNK